MKRLAVLSAVMLVAFGYVSMSPAGGATAISTVNVSTTYGLGVHAHVGFTDFGCSNKGPYITLGSDFGLGDLDGHVGLYQNKVKNGTVPAQFNWEITGPDVTPGPNGTWQFPKNPGTDHTGATGNPIVTFLFTDANGNHLTPVGSSTSEWLIGRCVGASDGSLHGQLLTSALDANLVLPATASASIAALECSNRGSSLSLNGSRRRSGFHGLLNLYNAGNTNGVSADATIDITIDAGGSNGNGGLWKSTYGGNPFVSLDLTWPGGGQHWDFNRCNKLTG
jgi:hypothetical protein